MRIIKLSNDSSTYFSNYEDDSLFPEFSDETDVDEIDSTFSGENVFDSVDAFSEDDEDLGSEEFDEYDEEEFDEEDIDDIEEENYSSNIFDDMPEFSEEEESESAEFGDTLDSADFSYNVFDNIPSFDFSEGGLVSARDLVQGAKESPQFLLTLNKTTIDYDELRTITESMEKTKSTKGAKKHYEYFLTFCSTKDYDLMVKCLKHVVIYIFALSTRLKDKNLRIYSKNLKKFYSLHEKAMKRGKSKRGRAENPSKILHLRLDKSYDGKVPKLALEGEINQKLTKRLDLGGSIAQFLLRPRGFLLMDKNLLSIKDFVKAISSYSRIRDSYGLHIAKFANGVRSFLLLCSLSGESKTHNMLQTVDNAVVFMMSLFQHVRDSNEAKFNRKDLAVLNNLKKVDVMKKYQEMIGFIKRYGAPLQKYKELMTTVDKLVAESGDKLLAQGYSSRGNRQINEVDRFFSQYSDMDTVGVDELDDDFSSCGSQNYDDFSSAYDFDDDEEDYDDEDEDFSDAYDFDDDEDEEDIEEDEDEEGDEFSKALENDELDEFSNPFEFSDEDKEEDDDEEEDEDSKEKVEEKKKKKREKVMKKASKEENDDEESDEEDDEEESEGEEDEEEDSSKKSDKKPAKKKGGVNNLKPFQKKKGGVNNLKPFQKKKGTEKTGGKGDTEDDNVKAETELKENFSLGLDMYFREDGKDVSEVASLNYLDKLLRE